MQFQKFRNRSEKNLHHFLLLGFFSASFNILKIQLFEKHPKKHILVDKGVQLSVENVTVLPSEVLVWPTTFVQAEKASERKHISQALIISHQVQLFSQRGVLTGYSIQILLNLAFVACQKQEYFILTEILSQCGHYITLL